MTVSCVPVPSRAALLAATARTMSSAGKRKRSSTGGGASARKSSGLTNVRKPSSAGGQRSDDDEVQEEERGAEDDFESRMQPDSGEDEVGYEGNFDPSQSQGMDEEEGGGTGPAGTIAKVRVENFMNLKCLEMEVRAHRLPTICGQSATVSRGAAAGVILVSVADGSRPLAHIVERRRCRCTA